MSSILLEETLKLDERIFPEPDRFAICAPADEPILRFYRDQFEAVYILFHPFLRPITIDKKRFNPGMYPKKSAIIEGCQAVSWKSVIELTRLNSIAEVDIGLRTSIGGLRKEVANDEFASEIAELYEQHNIVQPNEGVVADIIQNEIFVSFQTLGHKWLWLGDEFCTERKLNWIEDLKDKEEEFFPYHGNTFTPDKSILLTTHWDSHFSLICSSKNNIDRILENYPFEGFFCDEKTEIYWSLRNAIPG